MTPQQIDTVTNGLVNLHAFLDEHGPGLLAAAISAAGWWVIWRQHKKRTRRREGIRRLEHFANHPANRSRRNQQRKETDQP